MDGIFIAEGREPVVMTEVGHAEPPSTLRVLDTVPLGVEEQHVVFVLECRLAQQIEV